MARKLVSIRKILDLKPVENSDNLDVADIGGWRCVCGRGEFKKDDLVLYFEIDSFLPVSPEFEFLRPRCFKKMYTGQEGFRLRTVKLRGQVSQGLIMPLSTFPDIDFSDRKKDYSEDLGVIKYEVEIPVNLQAQVLGEFPTHIIRKTDQERIQNLPDYFEKYKGIEFEETTKYDGSSVTIYYHDDHFGVCSRNLELKQGDNAMWNLALKYKLDENLPKMKRNLAVQAELVGPKLQGNPLGLTETDIYVFDIYDIDNQRYVTSDERVILCDELELKMVPVVKIFNVFDDFSSVDELLEYVKGDYELNPKNVREGSVFKSTSIIDGETVSFKVVNNDYLLKKWKVSA